MSSSEKQLKLIAGPPDQDATNFNDIHRWSKSIPALEQEDKKRLEKLMAKKHNSSLDELRDQLYSVGSMPLQTFCTVGKYFGGYWLSHCGALDGNKYVCLDKLFYDVQNGECLIYSFGIANDWTFETAMAQLGCTVRTFDPTIDGKSKPETNLVF